MYLEKEWFKHSAELVMNLTISVERILYLGISPRLTGALQFRITGR